MEKLLTFQKDDTHNLSSLAKALDKRRFFDIFLTSAQAKIVLYILGQPYELWSNFLEGNCTLEYIKDSEKSLEDLIEEGHSGIELLALRLRYLLFEKAIDYYYSSTELQDHYIEEVSDDYELIDQLDDSTPEEKNIDQKKEPTPQIREEEDNFDDDEDEEDKPPNKLQDNPQSNAPHSDVEFNDRGLAVVKIPLSLFEVPEENEGTTEDDGDIPKSVKDQEILIRGFNKVYHSFEYDRETLIKRRKLEKSDMKLEETEHKNDDVSTTSNDNNVINLGSVSTSLKHLLGAIQEKRDDIHLNDFELRNLFMDVRKNRGKWASDERVGQEELYEAAEKVVTELRGSTEHSTPFLNKVSKREAPNYSMIIKKPMDLNTVMKKLRNLSYNSKKEFVDDLMLIWSNCLTYNADPKHFLRTHAIAMQKMTLKLIPTIPDITIKSRAELEKEEGEMELESKNDTPEIGAGKTSKKGRKATTKDTSQPEIKADPDGSSETPETIQPSVEPTVSTGEPAASTGEPTVSTGEQTVSTSTVTPQPDSNTNGEQVEEEEEEEDNDNDADSVEEEDDFDPEFLAWKSITAKSRAEYCSKRAELFDSDSKLRPDAPAIIRRSQEMQNFSHYLDNQEVVQKSANIMEGEEPYLMELDINGGLPGFVYLGKSEEDQDRQEQQLVDIDLRLTGSKHSGFVLPTNSGLNKVYIDNISEIQEIRKICFKISLIRQMQMLLFVHHTQMKQPEIETIKEIDVDPVSRLSNHEAFSHEIQYNVLRRNMGKIAMQTGFESSEPLAINTLTQLAERYMSNLIKSLKLHSESNSANKLTTREILLLSLLENGVGKPDDLYTFVTEKILKQQEKLKSLRSKLSNFLKELLRPGLESFNERSFEDNSEQFITGDFSNDIGDDFFGFKELGLDKEFNLLSSSVPIYLLHSKLHSSYTTGGSVDTKKKYLDLIDFVVPRITATDIDNQIGLLVPFYTKLLEKSKTHYIKNQKKKGESTEVPEDLPLIEDDELPQKQRNTRPRLPPTGKISSVKKKPLVGSFFLDDIEANGDVHV